MDADSPPVTTQHLKFADTHCHLDLPAFDADREAVVDRAKGAGVHRILVPALDLASSHRITRLAANHSGVFAAIGIHPTEAAGLTDDAVEELGDLAQDPTVVAIGEIGLDYFWVAEASARAQQRLALERQLSLARQVRLPVILHLREAGDAHDGPCAEDLMAILRHWMGQLHGENHALALKPGVLHSFAGSHALAFNGIALGFLIGVTGPVTYKNAADRRQIIANIPLDHLLLETDAPFLAPVPHRGRRNEPAFIPDIADRIAEIQSRTLPEVAELTEANANRLFAWGESV